MRPLSGISRILLVTVATSAADAQPDFTNFETPHVTPMAMAPSGGSLFVVNTPDSRLEVFDLSSGAPVWVASIPVGLDPVSVRARTDGEVWVVNHISDTISIVDVAVRSVVRTLSARDEPTDVVFAGASGRAFVTCSAANAVQVFDPLNPASPPIEIAIAGEDPRALAVSPDGATVYALVFESGNGTTVIDEDVVSDPAGPWSGANPPPNFGATFDPPMNPANPVPPRGALILKKDTSTGFWMDDNGGVWPPALVPWDLHDHDLALIDANTLSVGYIAGLMNLNMAISVRPGGELVVVGTDATNDIRFEPNLSGRFVHSIIAFVDPTGVVPPINLDLNPHLAPAYAAGESTVPQVLRDQSIADPRGIAWQADGLVGYVAGMGSNAVAIIDDAGNRLGIIEVGGGPTGVVVDEARNRLYVLNKFDATLSVIDTISHTEVERVPFFDPTPPTIREGRPALYDARATSGLGVTACASCHVDARMDQIAWDLGDPSGSVKPFNQTCQVPLGGLCEDWHPVKGPMATQTLQGIVGTEPLHWRGDREELAAFNPAFVSLLGDDEELSADEMQAFEGFLAAIAFPPNPYRTIRNELPTGMLFDGNPRNGNQLFRTARLDGGLLNCIDCHATPTGTNGQITPGAAMNTPQSMKIAQLRNLLEKEGFSNSSSANNRGFGFTHSGVVESLFAFLQNPVFTFPGGPTGDQQRRDIVAFLRCFPGGAHAGVGRQVTLDGANNSDPAVVDLLNTMAALAGLGELGLVVKGRRGGIPRGWAFVGGVFQSDRASEMATDAELRASAVAGSELTYTLVPVGSQTRIGIDRDRDGHLDRDELDHCGDPADPLVVPTEMDGDGVVGLSDLSTLLANFGVLSGATFEDGDLDLDGDVDITDLARLLAAFGRTC